MKIIGELSHPVMKITIFKMNEKLSVKFEHLQVEHIIKFRQGSGVETVEDVNTFFSPAYIDEIFNMIIATSKSRSNRFSELNDSALQKFPNII
jgi:hypothetical protein